MNVPSSSEPSSSAPAAGLEVRPFRALTYRQRDPGHLARVSSPAYDLVTAAGRDRLAEADPHNIVRLILPRPEPGPGEAAAVRPTGPDVGGTEAGLGDRARRSADLAAVTLADWCEQGVFDRDERPALWLYEMSPPGAGPSTAGWLGAVALPEPGSAAVLPHEDTFPGAVEGRRALLAATGTDLEPIVLAHDADAEVAHLTASAGQGPPTIEVADDDGVLHRLWRVTDETTLRRLRAALGRTGAVIADGHHRFAAARANAQRQPGLPGADAVLALLTPMGPGGLRVDPIHRVVPDLDLAAAVAAAKVAFRAEELAVRGAVDATVHDWLASGGRGEFLLTDGEAVVRLSEPTPDVLATLPAEAPSAWRRLDVVLAHHGLLAACWQRRDDPESVLIAHSVGEALATARERAGVALLLRAPSPADVAAVARAGARMPRKSTLFVPKPRTGLVLRPLAD